MRGGPASHIDQGRHSRFTARVLQRPEAFERNGVFCSKSKKCNNFGLYRLRCTRLFSFCFWFLYKTRYVFKFVCFLFLTKCAGKDNIILFTKATRNRIPDWKVCKVRTRDQYFPKFCASDFRNCAFDMKFCAYNFQS